MFGNRQQKREVKSTEGAYQYGNEELIELRHVVKTFDTAAGKFTALKSVDLRVDAGEFVAVIGKSGSGKSTLINMIAGIDRPSGGDVLVGNTAVHKLKEGKLAEWRGRNLGIVFQFFQLLPTLTLAENVMLPMDFCNMYKASERRHRAMALLDRMEMADHANKLPAAISGGQQQRVAIARALANDPPILIADEPTGNLDSKTADSMFQLFQQLVDDGKTILMVTHDNDLATRVTRSVIITDGEVIEKELANIFPSLTNEQLVAFTHNIDPDRFAPGAIILRAGEPVAQFSVILKGTVEIVIPQPNGESKVVATMTRGQYFGEIEMLRGGNSRATVRAQTPVELLRLDHATFDQMIRQSPELQATVTQIAQTRSAENDAARGNEA